ncbi:MAG: fasciclin domain-containing protein, partial [Candidatus Symbiothrix sp.]|nr:fasciclin domain-containing protein [Candidatus Symbiothrix sp.]
MNIFFQNKSFKNPFLTRFGTALILSLIVFTTCIDDNYDKNYTTFEEEQIASYLENHPELYSEFYALLKKTNVADLLNAYGTYTCFAPTNEAVKKYYAEKNTSLEQLTDKETKEIVYNHILPRKLPSTEIPNGAISFPNMDDRYLYFSFGNETNSSLTVYVNETIRILELDQKMHNGIIHTVDGVIVPSHSRLPVVIAKLER